MSTGPIVDASKTCVIPIFDLIKAHALFTMLCLHHGSCIIELIKRVGEKSYSMFVCFVCFVALRPKSTAMVMAGRSVHLFTLFPGQA